MDLRRKVRKGYLVEQAFQFRNPDRTPSNLVGLSSRVLVRTDYVERNGVVVVQFDDAAPGINGDTVSTPDATGRITLALQPATTVSLTGGHHYFLELQILNASGQPIRGVVVLLDVELSVYA